MSAEQLKAFLNALEADTGLQAKLKAAVESEIDTADETAAILAVAKEAGFTITAADLLRNDAQNILELSDEELEGMAGGLCSADFWRQAGEHVRQVATRVVREVGFGTC